MPPVGVWLLVIGIALFFVVLIVYTRRKERERTEALRRVAEAAGLAFEPTGSLGALRALGNVQLFDRGHSRAVTNLMSGRLEDQQVVAFDYRYSVGSGKHRHTTEQTVVLLPSAKPSLPDLQLAPENPLFKIAEMFGYQDIDIESSPEFSQRYLLRGTDEAAIRAAVYPGATSYFAAHQGWTVEARSGSVALYRANIRAKADNVRAFIAEALSAARSL
jgi:hypothetical protein